jgi:hypothetical protein
MTDKKQAQASTSVWDRNRGVIRSSIGGWVIGQGIMNRGYEMMTDFVGNFSYMQVVIFNATGRMPERPFAEWVEALYICLSWPDPRIWCNNIGALGGTAECSPVASTAAGVLATDARSYGVKPIVEGMQFIIGATEKYNAGHSVEDIVKEESARHGGKPLMMGYARPIAKGDERIPALERVREQKGIPAGKHLEVAFLIHDYLQQHYQESMNVNGYASAMMADHGYSPEEAYRIYPVVVASGVTACYVDTKDKPANTFLALRCDDIDYLGRGERPVPER